MKRPLESAYQECDHKLLLTVPVDRIKTTITTYATTTAERVQSDLDLLASDAAPVGVVCGCVSDGLRLRLPVQSSPVGEL